MAETPYLNITLAEPNGSRGVWGTITNEAIKVLEAMYKYNPFDTVVIGSGATGSIDIELQISGGSSGIHHWSLKHKTDDTFSLTHDGSDIFSIDGTTSTFAGSIEFSVSGVANIGSDNFPILRTYTKVLQGPDGADLYLWGAPTKSVKITDGSDTTRFITREGYANRFYDTTGALCLDVDENLGVYGNITPALASTSDIGTSAAPFASGYFNSLITDYIELDGVNIKDAISPTTSGTSNLGSASIPYGEIISDQFRLNKDGGKIIFNDDNYLSFDDSTGQLRLNGSTSNYIDVDNGFARYNTVYANTSFSAPNGSDVVIQAPSSQNTVINDSAGVASLTTSTSNITSSKTILPSTSGGISIGSSSLPISNIYSNSVYATSFKPKPGLDGALSIFDGDGKYRMYCKPGQGTYLYDSNDSAQLILASGLITVKNKLIPFATNTYDIGSISNTWGTIYSTSGSISSIRGLSKIDIFDTSNNTRIGITGASSTDLYGPNKGLVFKLYDGYRTDHVSSLPYISGSSVNVGASNYPYNAIYSKYIRGPGNEDLEISTYLGHGSVVLKDGETNTRIKYASNTPTYLYAPSGGIPRLQIKVSSLEAAVQILPVASGTLNVGSSDMPFNESYFRSYKSPAGSSLLLQPGAGGGYALYDGSSVKRMDFSPSNTTYIYDETGAARIAARSGAVELRNTVISNASGSYALGTPSYPWSNLYLTGGVYVNGISLSPSGSSPTSSGVGDFGSVSVPWGNVYSDSLSVGAISQQGSDGIQFTGSIIPTISGVNNIGSSSSVIGSGYFNNANINNFQPNPGNALSIKSHDGYLRIGAATTGGQGTTVYSYGGAPAASFESSNVSLYRNITFVSSGAFNVGSTTYPVRTLYTNNISSATDNGLTITSQGADSELVLNSEYGGPTDGIQIQSRGTRKLSFARGSNGWSITHLWPYSTNTYALGSTSAAWATLGVNNITSDTTHDLNITAGANNVSINARTGGTLPSVVFDTSSTIFYTTNNYPNYVGTQYFGSASRPWAVVYTDKIAAGTWPTYSEELLIDATTKGSSFIKIDGAVVERLVSSGSTDATEINWKQANYQEFELTADWTPTFNNIASSGTAHTVIFTTKQDATGNWTITWPAEVIWPGGTPPTVTSAANSIDIWEFKTFDGGVVIFGNQLGANYCKYV